MSNPSLTIDEVLERANLTRRELADLVNELIGFDGTEYIYHYTSAAGLRGIVTECKLWFTRWDSLNDTSENLIVHDRVEEVLQDFYECPDFVERIQSLNDTWRKLKEEKNIDNDLFIASFSLKSDALNMWNYYTKTPQSDGYCIGFDNKGLFVQDGYDIIVSRVIYDKKKQKWIVKRVLDKIYKSYKDFNSCHETARDTNRELSYLFDRTFAEISVFFKHPAFALEEEMRVSLRIHPGSEKHEQLKVNFRTNGGLILPYVVLPFERNVIKSVRTSPNLSGKQYRVGVYSLLDSWGMKVEVMKSEIPFRAI